MTTNRKRCPNCNKLKDTYGWAIVKRKDMKAQKECKECAEKARLNGELVVSY
ncbi:MAG: hypothetical protein MUP81_02860 [Dehalococcoidia bacterium]|nr:hypothetical protein [Dehalococcoidia bacterium]